MVSVLLLLILCAVWLAFGLVTLTDEFGLSDLIILLLELDLLALLVAQRKQFLRGADAEK